MTGGASQITEQRTGHLIGGRFFESLGGSLIPSRATIRMRSSSSRSETTSGRSGFRPTPGRRVRRGDVEQHAHGDPRRAAGQPCAGSPSIVPVLEANGRRAHRPLRLEEPARQPRVVRGRRVSERDGHHEPAASRREHDRAAKTSRSTTPVPDPEDDGEDVVAFADFMRATKAPPRGAITAAVRAGEQVFNAIGCATCHVASIVTARAGDVDQRRRVHRAGRARQQGHPPVQRLPAARHRHGRRHSDSADGEYAPTANQIRTAPLWGLRTRNRLMHDGLSFTQGGSDPAPRRAGGGRDEPVPGTQLGRQGESRGVSEFAVRADFPAGGRTR